MPNSEARKWLEERESVNTYGPPEAWPKLTLTCFCCGQTAGEGEIIVDGDTVQCVDAVACIKRVVGAKACLEPVTQV